MCKGKCCEEGERGGPLLKEESLFIEDNLQDILAELPGSNRQLIEKNGPVFREEGKEYTPLTREEGPCVYLVKGEDQISYCIFEKMFHEGKIDFQKPISCHLFPLIYRESKFYKVLSYEKRAICSSSFSRGPLLVEFERAALTRLFGEEFFKELLQTLGVGEKS